MFLASSLHEAPSWILGRNRRKLLHGRKLSDKLSDKLPPPVSQASTTKLKFQTYQQHWRAFSTGAESLGGFVLISSRAFPCGNLELVLQLSGISCSPLLCVCGQRCSNQPIRALGALGAGSPAHLSVILHMKKQKPCIVLRAQIKIWKHAEYEWFFKYMFLFLFFTLFLCHFIFLRSSLRTKYRDPNTLYYLYHVFLPAALYLCSHSDVFFCPFECLWFCKVCTQLKCIYFNLKC